MATILTWAERAALDESLRAFVDAEIARAGIDLQVLRVENEHQRKTIAEQADQIDVMRKAAKKRETRNAAEGA